MDATIFESKEFDERGNSSPIFFVELDDYRFMTFTRDPTSQPAASLPGASVRTERGWGAHFAGGDKCYFRRNTLIEVGDRRVVVSTVGNYHGTWEPLGGSVRPGDGRTYETMAFEAIQEGIYWEADVCKPFAFDGVQTLPNGSNDLEANNMHENAVDAVERQLVAS